MKTITKARKPRARTALSLKVEHIRALTTAELAPVRGGQRPSYHTDCPNPTGGE